MKNKSFHPRRQALVLAFLLSLAGLHPANAQTPAKKPAAPAPAKPAAPAAAPKPAASPAAAHTATASGTAHPGGATTTTTTTAGHSGPTTTTTTAGHTGSAATTTTTTTSSHAITTSSPGGPKTTTTTTTNSTVAPKGATATTTAGGGPKAATPGSPAGRGAPTTSSAAGTSHGGFGGSSGPGAHPENTRGPINRPAPAGFHEVRASNGATVRMGPHGERRDVHDERRGLDVHHGINGERRISVERADHSRIYAERGGRGFVQHPYMYHGREFGHRTYYYNGRAYDRYYGRYPYHGAYLDVYYPNRYYAPGFYGWAYNPWAAPINYSWGFNATPWYGYYGPAYFQPYPVYPSASFWLTDYLISQSLAAAYQAQVEAGAAAPLVGAAPLTPDVKKMVADEVQRQVALENAEAAQNAQKQDIDSQGSSIARMLSDNQPHVFIAGANLDLVDASGAECAVSQGDVLEVASPPPADATAANALVLSSKGGKECPKSANVQVAFTDLQDMQNHMRETIDAGLSDLQSKQGKGGLPPAPPSAKAPPVDSQYAAAAPPPDLDAANEIKAQVQEADKAEQEVASVTVPPTPGASGPSDAPAPPPTAAPPTVSIGQSVDSLTAAYGKPSKVLDKGLTKIYVYPDMKVTIKGDKITNLE